MGINFGVLIRVIGLPLPFFFYRLAFGLVDLLHEFSVTAISWFYYLAGY